MGHRLDAAPGIALLGIAAFAVAASAMAFVPNEPRLWSAAVGLIVLGGITPLIYAVNLRVVPALNRRTWRYPRLLLVGVSLGIAGAWLVFLGRAVSIPAMESIGHGLALNGGLVFVGSLVLLFRTPVAPHRVALPTPPGQAEVDRIGVRFTRLSGVYLLIGLAIGLVSSIWTPSVGRWDLVWAHTLLLGWFMTMAAGISYHVLSRWSGQEWRSPRRIQAHFAVVALGLPAMIVALALDLSWLFAIAGPFQAGALVLYVWNVAPLVARLPEIPRLGVAFALFFLTVGVSLGASVAIDPLHHTRLRFAHAEINLLGWAGLLVCGMGYYLFPRFAGQPLRWPRLARAQLLVHLAGVVTSASAWWWYLAIDERAGPFITIGALAVSASFLIFGCIIARTFRRSDTVVTEMRVYSRRSLPVR